MSLVVGVTGHANIEKIFNIPLIDNGQIYDSKAYQLVYNEILLSLQNKILSKNKDIILLSGMARGVDEIFAFIAMNLDLPLILAIPGSVSWHKNRGLRPDGTRAQAIAYDTILNYPKIHKIIEVGKAYQGKNYPFVNFARNQAIVDNSDVIMAYKKTKSTGTNDCIKRVEVAKKELILI